MNNYTDILKSLFHVAEAYSKENKNDAIHPAHLLKAVLHKDFGLIETIETLGKDYYYILDWAEARIGLLDKVSKNNVEIMLSDSSMTVLEEAENYKVTLNKEDIDPICVFISLCTPGVGFSFEQLKTLTITHDEIIDYHSKNDNKETTENKNRTTVKKDGKKALYNFCVDKLSMLNECNDEKIVGFEKEILTIIEMLGRKSKSNVLIVGESGVGKTALITGLVQRIAVGNIPEFFKNIQIFELDLGNLLAGASYKGEIEDRFKKITDEIKSFDKALLIIESIENIFDKYNPLFNVSSIIKQELNKGGFIIIATSTVAGYTKNLETDSEFNSKFEKLKVNPPTEEKANRIISEIILKYIDHHTVQVEEKVIQEAIRLSKRYLNERSLPSSAIDLLDRAMSLVNTMNAISLDEILHLIEKFNKINENHKNIDSIQLLNEINWLYQEVFDRVSHSLIAQIDDGTDFYAIKQIKDKLNYISSLLEKLKVSSEVKKEKIDEYDLNIIISQLSGIPLGKISSKERDKLVNAEDFLKKRVCGQDHAIRTIVESIYESRAGLNKKGQPMGSFFFLGPTGTGKTELAKTLAEFLFQDESSMIRFDMSEFKEEHSAALLLGAPPGYVGYEEGGLLINKIRQKPYSVLLFDEIEKAHASVFDIFLQILDEGKLHDKLGREGDFTNSLVLFTSNIGSDYVFESFEKNNIPKSNVLIEIMSKHFRPEFLGRLTEVVPFAPITEDIVLRIFEIHFAKLISTIDELGIKLIIDEPTKKALAATGYSKQLGARPILGVIRNSLRRPLSKLLISGQISKGSEIELKLEGDDFIWVY